MVKKASLDRKKIRKLTKKFYPKVQEFESEMDFIIMNLRDKNVSNRLKNIIREYAMISAVSMFEYFFKNLAHKVVNKENIDISALVSKQSIKELNIKHPKISEGQIIVSVYDFSDPCIVNKIFSHLYGLRFFKSVEIIHNDDLYRVIGGGRPLKIDWKDFYNMFEFRNSRLHELKGMSLSNSRVINTIDNALNIIDIGMGLSNRQVRRSDIDSLNLPVINVGKLP